MLNIMNSLDMKQGQNNKNRNQMPKGIYTVDLMVCFFVERSYQFCPFNLFFNLILLYFHI